MIIPNLDLGKCLGTKHLFSVCGFPSARSTTRAFPQLLGKQTSLFMLKKALVVKDHLFQFWDVKYQVIISQKIVISTVLNK